MTLRISLHLSAQCELGLPLVAVNALPVFILVYLTNIVNEVTTESKHEFKFGVGYTYSVNSFDCVCFIYLDVYSLHIQS
jgi:hypothetical protein